jgi:hypothetical protein
MFIEGFAKTAGPTFGTMAARTVGRMVTAPSKLWRAAKRVGSENWRALKGGVEEGARTGKKPERGSTLLKAQERKITSNLRRKNPREFKHPIDRNVLSTGSKLRPTERAAAIKADKESIKQRQKGVRNANKGPSFAGRHPLLTAGAGAAAYKAMTGEKKESPDPVVYSGGQ